MKSKPTKRFFTESEITEQIDRKHDEAFLSLQKAERLEEEYHQFIRLPNLTPERKDELGEIKKMAKKLRAKHRRIHDSVLPKLGEKLAMFRTDLLPVVTTDKSIKQ